MLFGDAVQTFRDVMEQTVPVWLLGRVGRRYLYAHQVQADAAGDALVAGVQTRFPGYYSNESLPTIGRERRILRGLFESSENYAARLRTWFDTHAHRGSALAMLEQLYLHWAPNNFPIQLIARSGLMHTLAVDGTITRSQISWNPDATPDRWAQWWLIMYTDFYGNSPSVDDVNDIRAIPWAWNSAHTQGHIILLPTGAELWNSPDPIQWSSPGTWNSTIAPIYIEVPN